MGKIPLTTDAASAEFVTDALRTGAVIDAASAVAEVEHDPIGEGVGIVGQLARLTLRYSGSAHGAPSSVILKIPSQFPENRAVGDGFRFYEREGRFYEQIGDHSAVRTAHCYFNHIDADAAEYALLLEDFGDRTIISQVAGIAADRVAEALRAVAQIHAEWWQSSKLDALDWMPRAIDPVMLAPGEHYRQATPVFLERAADVLPPGGAELAARIGPVWEQLMFDGFERNPHTIVHGDFRADNLMFDDSADGRDHVGIIDWQISYRGPAISDVAYLLTQSMTVDDRRANERDLVASWYDAVCSALGAAPDDFDEADAWEEYRRTTAALTVYPVVSMGSMDPANERGRQLVSAMTERAFAAALDHGADAVVTEVSGRS